MIQMRSSKTGWYGQNIIVIFFFISFNTQYSFYITNGENAFHMFLDLKNEYKHNFFFQLNSE